MDRRTAEATLVEFGHDPRFLSSSRFNFLQACQKGPLRLAEAFIVCGMPMRATTDREPPIVKAAESGKLEHVQLILDHGGSLDTKDIVGDTALHTAANWGHVDLVRELHALGANLDTINTKNWTPLTKALEKSKTEIVKVLLDCGANPDFGREHKATPLAFAKDTAMFVALLEAGAPADLVLDPQTGSSLLLSKAGAGKTNQVEALLKHGARDEPNRSGWTAYMVASDRRAPNEALAALLKPEGDVTAGDSRLQQAAVDGDVTTMESLIADGVSIDGVNRWGSTALIAASSKKLWDMVAWLLDAGADATIANAYANSALTFAAGSGELRLVERLIAAGAPANEGAVYGEPETRSLALVMAASAGHLEVVRSLVDAGARLDSRDKFEQTALFLAGSRGHHEVVSFLLGAGADPNVGGRATTSPLLIAQANARAKCVALLVEAGAELEQREMFQRTALHRICDAFRNKKEAHGHIVRTLLDAGADFTALDDYDYSPFDLARNSKNGPALEVIEAFLTTEFLARHKSGRKVDWAAAAAHAHTENIKAFIHRDDVKSIRSLLDGGLPMTVFTDGPKPLFFAALSREEPQLARLLLSRGVDPFVTQNGRTALMVAAGKGHLELTKALLGCGLDANAVSEGCSTPLTSAASGGNIELAQLLLGAGADPSPFAAGWTPLMRAAQKGDLAMTQLLLEAGADPNVVNSQKQTALLVAQKKKAANVVELLGEHTKPDIRDTAGRTSLFRACVKGDLAAVTHLLAAGADPTTADEEGDTPNSVGALRADVAEKLGVAFSPLRPATLDWDDDPFADLRRGAESPEPDVEARNPRGDTALHLAVLLGDKHLTQSLIERGADVHAVNEIGETPWSIAVNIAGSLEEILREAGAKVDANAQVITGGNISDFRVAMSAGDLRDVSKRIENMQVNPHLLGRYQTPLRMAIGLDDDHMLALLLDMGCDPLVTSYEPILASAAARGNPAVVRRLLEAGLPLDPHALQRAAEAGRADTVSALLDAGARLEEVRLDHITAEALRSLIDVALGREHFDVAERATELLREAAGRG